MSETLTVDWEHLIFQEISDLKVPRRSVAQTYSYLLRSPNGVDWAKVNAAIIERWSRSGLLWIKKEAWKQL